MKRFWNWLTPENADPNTTGVRVLSINGEIAAETWFDDDVTPQIFASELNAGTGDVVVWLNSPGGDVVAAAQIYNMIAAYPGTVTVNIDGVAASAASVIAMAADVVSMSPVSMMMIHNPATFAVGDKQELSRALDMLDSVKESIINAYQLKTGLSRAKLSKLMDQETWMDARAALDLGFADQILTAKRAPQLDPDEEPDDTDEDDGEVDNPDEGGSAGKKPPLPPKKNSGVLFSRRVSEQRLVAQLTARSVKPPGSPSLSSTSLQPAVPVGRRVVDLYAALFNQSH